MISPLRTTLRGQLTLHILIFSTVAIIILSGFVLWADASIRAVYRDSEKSLAFMIAESGVEYYRWHLAHNQSDYQDGTGNPGPYTHNFTDKDGTLLGTFSLDIAPPPNGSTVVHIVSTGQVSGTTPIEKQVEAKLAIPSFAKYAFVVAANTRFGAGTEVFGPIHSNSGIRFDGYAHNLVTSSLVSYNDEDHQAPGTNPKEWAVHTHVAPKDGYYPSPLPTRTDVFAAGRKVGENSAPFTNLTQDLNKMKTDAQANGAYLASTSYPGYEIVLKTNDTYDLYYVTAQKTPASTSCTNTGGQTDWATWTVGTRTLIRNSPFPANGIIFAEDNVWVRGQIDGARVTIAAGCLYRSCTSTQHSIAVTDNVLYTNYDGSDVLSLIAQNNINIGLESQDILRVDAALMAQNGRVGRYYYPGSYTGSVCTRYDRRGNCTQWSYQTVPGCSPYHARNTITSYGMIASNLRYGFAYTDGTGYTTRNIIYDANLLYAPPPEFPLTADFYTPIFWNELR